MSQLKVNRITDLNNADLFKPTLMTAINTTSGTSHDFTGIPSWAKKITVMFSGVSTSGASAVQVQLGGASSFVTTGYISVGAQGTTNYSSTTGLVVGGVQAGDVRTGAMTILNFSGLQYVSFGSNASNTTSACSALSGKVTLSEALTRIRITTVNGTDTFDAGIINVMYE